jgi:hypothetical protein
MAVGRIVQRSVLRCRRPGLIAMSVLVVNCPKCSKGLKLRDRGKLGKKARCPKCSHVFILSAPPEDDEDEVELQLASDAAPQPATQPDQPAVGVSAKWVPDNAHPLQQATAQPQTPQPAAAEQPAASGYPEVSTQGTVTVAAESLTSRPSRRRTPSDEIPRSLRES